MHCKVFWAVMCLVTHVKRVLVMKISACSCWAPPCRAVSIVCFALSSVSIRDFLRISVCLLPLAMFYFLQPIYFTMDLARHMASLNRSKNGNTQRQAFILLHIVFFICVCGTHAHCGCFGWIRNTASGSDLYKHLCDSSFKNRVAECLFCLLKESFLFC